MPSVQRHNPPESTTMRKLDYVVKIRKSFHFLPCIYYENPGPHDGPLVIIANWKQHWKSNVFFSLAHRSNSKLKPKLKIKLRVLMAHRSHRKLKTNLKIKCFDSIFNAIFYTFYFNFFNFIYFLFVLIYFKFIVYLLYLRFSYFYLTFNLYFIAQFCFTSL